VIDGLGMNAGWLMSRPSTALCSLGMIGSLTLSLESPRIATRRNSDQTQIYDPEFAAFRSYSCSYCPISLVVTLLMR
jgi:hypothetical protein